MSTRRVGERRTPSPSSTTTALAVSTRTMARRCETTQSGSYVALRTSASPVPPIDLGIRPALRHPRRPGLPARASSRPLRELSHTHGPVCRGYACHCSAQPCTGGQAPVLVGGVREGGSMRYPPAARSDVVDTLHGRLVPDPYRWLEDASAP